jgi:hypothetical protein
MAQLSDTIDLYKYLDSVRKPQSPTLPRTYNDLHHRAQYRATKNAPRFPAHIGQLKLFLAEIDFLTKALAAQSCKDKHPQEEALHSRDSHAVVVYAGSAPSNKLSFISDMFPNVKFILVDPHEHLIKYADGTTHYGRENTALYLKASIDSPNEQIDYYSDMTLTGAPVRVIRKCAQNRVDLTKLPEIIKLDYKYFIIEEPFTDEIAKHIVFPHLFISDIRSMVDGDEPRDIDILLNSAANYNWIKIMRPSLYMIKFRCPYAINEQSITQLKNDIVKYKINSANNEILEVLINNFYKGIFTYIRGELHIQAFAPNHSTEMRLIGDSLDMAAYDVLEYEERLFYHNMITRHGGCYGAHQCDPIIGIDSCYDCALMMAIFNDYELKYNVSVDRISIIKGILNSNSRTLKEKETLHGLNIEVDAQLNVNLYNSRLCAPQSIKLINPIDGLRRLIARNAIIDENHLRYLPLFDMFGYKKVQSIIGKESPKLLKLLGGAYNERDINDKCRQLKISKNNIVKATYGVSTDTVRIIEEYLSAEYNGVPYVEIAETSQLKARKSYYCIYENIIGRVLARVDDLVVIYIIGAELTLLFYIYEAIVSSGSHALLICDMAIIGDCNSAALKEQASVGECKIIENLFIYDINNLAIDIK